jgi:hypothetical protein
MGREEDVDGAAQRRISEEPRPVVTRAGQNLEAPFARGCRLVQSAGVLRKRAVELGHGEEPGTCRRRAAASASRSTNERGAERLEPRGVHKLDRPAKRQIQGTN